MHIPVLEGVVSLRLGIGYFSTDRCKFIAEVSTDRHESVLRAAPQEEFRKCGTGLLCSVCQHKEIVLRPIECVKEESKKNEKKLGSVSKAREKGVRYSI